jgi:hypothetical protein
MNLLNLKDTAITTSAEHKHTVEAAIMSMKEGSKQGTRNVEPAGLSNLSDLNKKKPLSVFDDSPSSNLRKRIRDVTVVNKCLKMSRNVTVINKRGRRNGSVLL